MNSSLTTTFRQLVANQFAKRPTLHEVVAKAGFATLVDRYPWIPLNHPQLTSLEPFRVIQALDKGPATSAFVQTLLEHFLSGKSLAFTAADVLSIAPPEPFLAQAAGANPGNRPAIGINLENLNADLDQLLVALPQAFQQAQAGFWAASDATSGLSRLHWLAHTLKAALLAGIERQGLPAQAKHVLYSTIDGSQAGFTLHALQITLDDHAARTLPDLLITGEPNLVLWCMPSGAVRSYQSLAAFAEALGQALAERYQFSRLSWAKQLLETDPFHHQACALLNDILDKLGRLQLSTITTVQALEEAFSLASDPADSFFALPVLDAALPAIAPPGWLARTDASGHLLYADALLDLAASQARSQNQQSFETIEDLQRYTTRRLRERMQLDHPGHSVPDPEQLLVEISVVVPLSSAGPAQLDYLKSMSLTELAIARLHSDANEVASGLVDSSARPLDSWLTLDYIERLITNVDVGGQYPGYVAEQLQTSTLKAARIEQHASQWRHTLRFAALRARLEGKLCALACQAIGDFCQNRQTPPASLGIAPLAFLPAPGASAGNEVHGAFLIEVPASQSWVLYCPLLVDDALVEFANQDALMARVRADQVLQQHLLAWMDDDARAIYQNGGFERPHLHPRLSSLAHLLSAQTAWVDSALERLRVPVRPLHQPWPENLNTPLFETHIQTMLLMASRQSVSNAQQRWAMAVQLAWLVFNTATPLLRGPAAAVAWLVATLATLKNDLPALLQGSAVEKALAAADLLGNLAMALTPAATGPAQGLPRSPALHTPALEHPTNTPSTPSITPEAPKAADWVTVEHSQSQGHVRVTSWHNSQRLGNLPPELRLQLSQLRARVSLQGHTPQPQGRLRGVYPLENRLYVTLQGDAYEVQETWGGIQVIGPDDSQTQWQSQWAGAPDGYYIVGRERRTGPWLTRWNDEWVLNLNLAGGMPKTREAINQQNRQQYETLQATTQANKAELARLDPIVARNRVQLRDFDDLSERFGRAFSALPDPDVHKLPEALGHQYAELIRLRSKHRPQLVADSLFCEKQAALLQANVSTFRQMLEPRFLKFDRAGTAAQRLSDWTETSLDTDIHLYRRLLVLFDHEELEAQTAGLHSFPETEAQKQRHSAYRASIHDSLKNCRRLLEVSERLDKTLPEALNDHRVDYRDKKAKIERVIRLRPYSSLIVRAQILADQAYLTLDKTLLSPNAAANLLPLQASLSSQDLTTTLWSHDGLAAANLPADQQVEVLNNAVREYRSAIGRAQYLQSLTTPALDRPLLDAYIDTVGSLERMAQRELSAVLTSTECGTAPPVQVLTHRVRAARHTLIRTSRGRSVLVERDQEGARAVQHNPITQQPAGTYERRNDQWFEVADEHRPTTQDSTQLRHRAKSLLAQKDARIALAARYSSEPNSLMDLLDWQIQDMREVEQQLGSANDHASTALSAQLHDAIATVTTEKQRLLTDAYLDTRHPDSSALRYLYQQKRIQITLTKARKPLRNANDYLDVYQIKDVQAPSHVLWEAHFHYHSADAAPRDFAKAHLKLWEPRPEREREREARLERANTAAERIEIYRGDLRLAQVEGIIPFPAS